jgi:hypothetical protein
MADISYARTFTHEDWIENEDVVQASGEKGFNRRFHGIENEFDTLANVVTTIDTKINNIQRLFLFLSGNVTSLAANTATAEFQIETYDRSILPLPDGTEKLYFAVISPVSGPTHIQHTFLYRTAGANKIAASVQFFNPGTTAATFTFKVMTNLETPSQIGIFHP